MGSFEGRQREDEDRHLTFDQVKAKYEGRVFNLILRMVGEENCQDAEDLTVQTFTNAWRAWSGFRRDSRVYTWLFMIANNLVKNWYKRRSKQRERLGHSLDENMDGETDEISRDIADWSAFPETLILESEFVSKLKEVIDGLPPDYRVVMILSLLEELSYEEIARVVGISVPAVKTRLHRARNKVRQRLEPYYRGRFES